MQIRLDYTPLPAQKEFHENSSKIRLASGGVRSGKTKAGAMEFLMMALESPGMDGLLLGPTYKTLNNVSLREFRSLLNQCPQIVSSESKGEGYIELINGSRCYYRSADNPMSFDGMTIAFFWADEARYYKREAWTVLMARLSAPKAKSLRGIVTTTPAMNWLYEEFCQDKPGREIVRFRTTDNYHLHGDYIEDLKASMSKERFRQYVEGEFVATEGAVFDDFSTDHNICDLEIDRTYPVHVGLDPGLRHPAAVFFQLLDHCPTHRTRNCMHIIDEITDDNCPTVKLAPKIFRRLNRFQCRHGTVYADPAANAGSVTVGFSDVTVLESEGLRVKWSTNPASRHIPNGIEAIRSKICNVDGKRSLFISKDLLNNRRGIILALQNTVYPERAANGKISDYPIKDDKTHILDALRYAVVNLFPPSSGGVFVY